MKINAILSYNTDYGTKFEISKDEEGIILFKHIGNGKEDEVVRILPEDIERIAEIFERFKDFADD